MSEASDRPVLRVVRGDPSEEELAALVAAVAARRASDSSDAATSKRRSAWGDPAYAARPPLRPSPDGWRRSALPR